jgi:hypothetical protein
MLLKGHFGERAVIGMAGVSDGIFAAVSRRVEAVLAPAGGASALAD